MRSWLMKSLAMVAALFMLAGGPFMSSASAGAKIALVLDVGGRGDLSFNDMGFKGTDEAQANLGVEVVEIQSNSAADYLPNIAERCALRQVRSDRCCRIFVGRCHGGSRRSIS